MLRLGLATAVMALVLALGSESAAGLWGRAMDNEPPACRHSQVEVCRGLTRQKDLLGHLRRIMQPYWTSLPDQPTATQFIEISRNATQSAEDSVYELTLVTRDQQRAELDAAKTAIIAFLKSSSDRRRLFDGPDGARRLERLVDRLDAVTLRYGREWVESAAAEMHGEREGPGRRPHRARAWLDYHETCGREGDREEMFTSSFIARDGLGAPAGPDGEGIVPCPGLVLGLADYAADREDIPPALQFFLGLQLGQIITAETADIWAPETQLKACYGEDFVLDVGAQSAAGVNPDPAQVASTLAAQCWGGFTLGRRLGEIDSVSRRVRVAALALQPHCQNLKQAPPAIRRWLMHHIGLVPTLAAQLSNAAPALDQPYCAA